MLINFTRTALQQTPKRVCNKLTIGMAPYPRRLQSSLALSKLEVMHCSLHLIVILFWQVG